MARSPGWPVVSEMAGVAVLGFAFFNTLQVLFYLCISSMPPPTYTCYLGLHPLLVPPLFVVGAVLLGLGFLMDRPGYARTTLIPPPGLVSILIGAGLVEVGTLYLYNGAGGWSPPWVAPILFPVAGLVLALRGGWRWWRSRQRRELMARASAAPVSLAGPPETGPPPKEATLPVALQAVAIALVATAVVGILNRVASVTCPACDVGSPLVDPSAAMEVIAAGGVFLVASLFLRAARRRPRGQLTGVGVLEAGLGGAVLAMIPNVAFTAMFSFFPLSEIYALVLLSAGGLLWASGTGLVP